MQHLCYGAIAAHEAGVISVDVCMLARHQVADHALCRRRALINEVLHSRHQPSLRGGNPQQSQQSNDARHVAEHAEHNVDSFSAVLDGPCAPQPTCKPGKRATSMGADCPAMRSSSPCTNSLHCNAGVSSRPMALRTCVDGDMRLVCLLTQLPSVLSVSAPNSGSRQRKLTCPPAAQRAPPGSAGCP